MWADTAFSSYLLFALPERPDWSDPRFEVYPAAHWQEYVAIENASTQWQALLDGEGVNLLFLARYGQPNLVAVVAESRQWCEQYKDDMSIIFTRCVKK